ncbi:uncharacterized protein LOC6612448 [Drosophila sechellia]|uniref:GM12378 n=1 Tax=Drosophila sechellia TaxID=7238 RepID=B4I0T4_DROSE|nr:uncharacterized protein LOC6612448 [Drosophila sechellia]EDW53115.1 GM12378 [Drosophila sechellia]
MTRVDCIGESKRTSGSWMELAGIRFGTSLWLLLLHFSCILANIDHTKCKECEQFKYKLPVRCRYLLENVQVFERKCGGTYPLMAFTKYRDTFIKTGEPYALYMPSSLDYVMLLMKDSAMQSCARIQVGDTNTFFCLDDSTNETIKLDVAHMYCFPFHIQLPDDLMQECLMENQMTNGFLNDILRTRRGIIHYTFGSSRGHRLDCGYLWPKLLLLVPHLLPSMMSRKFLCELP